jgi:hypothetical protein
VATRPRGVRAGMPTRTTYGSQTSTTVRASPDSRTEGTTATRPFTIANDPDRTTPFRVVRSYASSRSVPDAFCGNAERTSFRFVRELNTSTVLPQRRKLSKPWRYPLKLKISLACVCLTLVASATLAAPAAAAPTASDRAAQTCGGGLSARIGVWEFQESRVAKAGTRGVEVGYSVTLQPGANAFFTAEAKGYDAAGNETWYGLGTSSSNLRRMVPWGNSLAHPAVKILNNGPALAPPFQWAC